MGVRLGWAVAEATARASARRKLDLLEMEETFGAAFYTQKALDLPVVVRLHGPVFLNSVALGMPTDEDFHRTNLAERRCITEAVGVTSPSRDVLEKVRQRYGVELPDARVIPNPAPSVAPADRWRLEACQRRTILFVGRFDRHKAGDVMLDAFREVARQIPDAELVFVGPDRGLRDDAGVVHSLPTYLQRALPLETRGRVRVTGPLAAAAIGALRRQAYVTVVPSRYENFPVALVEALATGSPTIASDAGGIPEIVQDGVTGLLFRAGDPADLTAKLVSLFGAPERAAELGRRAAEDVAQRFNVDFLARTTLDYYRALLDRPRAVGRRLSLTRAIYALTARPPRAA